MKEFDFNSVGKRMPYSVPEEFFEVAKAQAKDRAIRGSRVFRPIIYKVAIAAVAAVLAVCGATVCFELYNSPDRQYERLLAEISTDVLWDYACEYNIDIDNEDIY